MYIKGYSNHAPTVLEEHIAYNLKEIFKVETVLYLMNAKAISNAKLLPNISV